MITKNEMIEMLIESPMWDGTKDKKVLSKYSKIEIKDAFDEMIAREG